MVKRMATLAVLFLAAVTISCSPLENRARDAIAVSKGFIAKAQQNHLMECNANPYKPFPCAMINQAVGAQNMLADAAALYCGWPVNPSSVILQGPPLACTPHQEYAARLTNAVNSINAIMRDYKLASRGAK